MKVSYRKRTSDPTWPRAMRGQAVRRHLKRWTGVYAAGIELRNLRIREQTVSSKPESKNAMCDGASAARPCGVEDPTHA